MRFDTVVKNGLVVTASDSYVSDIGIAGGKITAIAQGLPVDGASKIIDATGLMVMPGGIDVHTHLDMPFGGTNSADDFESGTIAAAFGGTTTLIDFAIQTKGQSLRHVDGKSGSQGHD
jgi:dihydropyrimidinase